MKERMLQGFDRVCRRVDREQGEKKNSCVSVIRGRPSVVGEGDREWDIVAKRKFVKTQEPSKIDITGN
jgi:hypothetical protein